MIWKDEPGVDFLDVRIENQAEKFVQETADELKTFPLPLETNLQSELEQIPCEKETPTQNLRRPPPTIPPTPNLMISSPTISLPSNPIPETSTLPIQPERRLGYFNSFSKHYYFADSYEACREKENIATLQSDINSTSETEQNMGKVHRNKKPTKRFMQDTDVHDSSSADSRVGMYGRTQPGLLYIPAGLAENAVEHSRQVVNGSTHLVQQNADLSQSSTLCVLQSQQLSGLFDFNSPLAGQSLTSADGRVNVNARISPGLNNRNFPAPAINTEGSENMVKRLVREVLKQQENISNVMEKLIVIEGKMENLCQPAITPPDNPTLLLEPLKEEKWKNNYSIKIIIFN
ncbi:Uncharacterized protein APZ42_025354 [Daphnia magna]|uniref:Uncharacterized protein n=1 Tax=Daphnia magna TaxID=35525 RepID=A0A164T7F7_9CRUS|nr:Uncharacterized protein APZ42_025354 [Daphnia magna]